MDREILGLLAYLHGVIREKSETIAFLLRRIDELEAKLAVKNGGGDGDE